MGGGPAAYTPPPPTPVPIEDSIKARHEAAALTAKMASDASREGTDLNEDTASRAEAVTRSDLSRAETFAAQAQPRGPVTRRPQSPRLSPASAMGGGATSAVLTG